MLLRRIEESIVFQPPKYPEGDWDTALLDYEDAWIRKTPGRRLHGWLCEAAGAARVVLYAHGNAGNISTRAATVATLHHQLGATVLAFDYSGYGRSEGRPTEAQILRDARDARSWLAERKGIATGDVILLGRSLGGAVAIDLALDGAKAVIVINTFTSLPDVAAKSFGRLVRLVMRMKLDSLSKIARLDAPILVMHGTADELIPLEHGQRLFDAAREPKACHWIEGGQHNEPMNLAQLDAIKRFVGVSR